MPRPGPVVLRPRSTLKVTARRPGLPDALRQALAASCAAGAGASPLDDALGAAEQRLTATLLALDARLRIGGDAVPLDDRLTLDGRILPRPGEAPGAIVVPVPRGVSCYREAPDLGLGLAAVVSLTGPGNPARVTGIRAVWWGVAPAPLIAYQLAGVLQGRSPTPALIGVAAETARGEAQPAGAGMALHAGATRRRRAALSRRARHAVRRGAPCGALRRILASTQRGARAERKIQCRSGSR